MKKESKKIKKIFGIIRPTFSKQKEESFLNYFFTIDYSFITAFIIGILIVEYLL